MERDWRLERDLLVNPHRAGRTLFLRKLNGEDLAVVAKSVNLDIWQVFRIHDDYLNSLIYRVADRLSIPSERLRLIPGDVLSRLGCMTREELCTIYVAGGDDAVGALVLRPHFNDNRAKELISALQSSAFIASLERPPGRSHYGAVVRAHLAKGSKGRPRQRVVAEIA